MKRQEKQQEVFLKLVNRQLLPFGKTYEDVKSDSKWYLRYVTTEDQERDFMNWGVELLRTELDMTRKLAEKEMSWFIVQWGLTCNREALQNIESVEKKAKTTKSK